MNSPLVSCVIPCYNRGALVRDTIDSVLRQTYEPVEIIAVDDGSTDDTNDVLASYGNEIRVIRQENGGTASARNTGIRESKGKYLAWLDSDDTWLPEKTAAEVDVLERHAGVAQVYTAFVLMDVDGNPKATGERVAIPDAEIKADTLAMLLVESVVMPSSSMVRRSALDDVGWFDPSYDWEDWELNFRLARKFPFAYIDAPLMRYRVHNNSKSADLWLHSQGMLQLRAKFEAARTEILAADPSTLLRDAYEKHRRKYADAYYRFGKSSLARGDIARAQQARTRLSLPGSSPMASAMPGSDK